MTHGSGDGMTLGITGATGADGTTRSTTGDSGDGTTLGTTVATGGIIHGIRTTPDGTADSVLIGDMATAMVTDLESEAADISAAGLGTDRAMRRRATHAYSPTAAKRRQSEEASAQAAAPDAAPSAEAHRQGAAPLRPRLQEAHRRQEGQ